MGTAGDLRTGRRGAVWEVLPRALESAVLVILVLAAGTEIVTAAVGAATVVQYAPVAVIVAAVVAGYRYPYIGLVLACAAPLLAVWVGRAPTTGIWSMACFLAFLFTLRGLPALLTGAAIALANFGAVAWELGTIDVNTDATASIAAFAAVVCAAIGSAVRGNHRYRLESERRLLEAETTRRTAVERGVAQERLRIARDLHDSVGHQIAVVSMRLGAAEVHLPDGAAEARADLSAAREGVQTVLRETQQILAVLRVGEGDERSRPAPDHATLRQLVETFRDAGMSIEASVEDVTDALSAPARVAVYRILQEALTNAQKHGTGTISAAVRRRDDSVEIEVVNIRGARDPSTSGGGNGLVGMGERAGSVGGTLTTRADERLFWTTASIPVEKAIPVEKSIPVEKESRR